MNTQGTLSSWTKALFISIFCHSLFLFILFCWQTAPPDSQPETTELYEMDLTQSLAGPSELVADNSPSDSDLPEEEQTLASTPSPTAQDEKKPPESEQNLNPPPPDIKPPRTPTNDKQNTLEPKIKIETKVKPIYPEKFVQTKQHFTIILLVNISELGQPNLIQVKQSSGSTELDNAAIAAIKQWRYYPAIDLATGQQKSFVFPDFVVTDIDFTYPEKNLSQQSL